MTIKRMQQRHDTAANWTSANPVLFVGEIGYETDTAKFKFGDNITAWASLPYNQIPLDVMEYKGVWNAATNSPTLADGTGNTGDFYHVSPGGTQNLGSGSITFVAGDYLLYNGTTWEKSNTTNAVASVFGRVGAVTGTPSDVSPASAAPITTNTSPTRDQITVYDATPGALAVALPALSGLTTGWVYPVQRYQLDTSVNAITFTPNGADTFDSGATAFSLPLTGELRYFQVVTVSASKKWKVVNGNTPLSSLDTRYRGAVATGVKGGKATLLRRRDITNLDLLSPWCGSITTTITHTGVTTIASAQTYSMSATPSWCTPLGGNLVAADSTFATGFFFNWRASNGGAVVPTTFPWPTATVFEFELDTTTLGAFEVSFKPRTASTSFFYQLWIDGRRVWDLPQAGAITQNSANNFLKFGGTAGTTGALPPGVHKYRVALNNSEVWQIYTPQNTIPAPVPARGLRVMFVGDSLMSIGANLGTSGVHTGIEMGAWPWLFGEMIGCNDLWIDGMGATGAIATAGGRTVTDGAIVSGSNVLQSATAGFVTGDTGAPPANIAQVVGAGPGGGVLSALIVSRTDATHVVLDTTASTTVTNAWTRIGGSAANFVIRAITDVVPAAPDVVIMGGWHNDAGFGAAAIADAYNRTITTIQTALPNTMIIPFGAWDSAGVGGASYTTIDDAVLAVCTARKVAYIETANNGNVYDGDGNIVATQGKWIDTNTANIYTCSDGTHETDPAMKYLAHRFTQAVNALLPA